MGALALPPARCRPAATRLEGLDAPHAARRRQHLPSSLPPAEELAEVLNSSITWGYNLLERISCESGLVSNWWKMPAAGWPWRGDLTCANSGTLAGGDGDGDGDSGGGSGGDSDGDIDDDSDRVIVPQLGHYHVT